jgi:peptide chain release factor subunit 1
MEIHNSLIVDTSPYVRPLARIHDEWESFTLVLLNSNNAKIYSVSLGKVDATKRLSEDIMNKHKKGGMSQARFQRLRKGAIHAFYAEVVEVLDAISDDQIVLAGPGQAKIQFKEMMPKHLQDHVIDIIDISMDDEKSILKESIEAVKEKEKQQSHEAVVRLKHEILKDGLAVYGIQDTLQAVKNGQVELLILEKDYKQKGYLCEHCQIVKTGKLKTCTICGGPTSEVDVLEEILEFAERTQADIEFTADEEISLLGHVGALLRYK